MFILICGLESISFHDSQLLHLQSSHKTSCLEALLAFRDMISEMVERDVGVIELGPSLNALLKNDDGGSAHLPRQDARGGGKRLHVCMTRKQVTLAEEDCEIMSVSARPAMRSTQLQVKSAPAATDRLLSKDGGGGGHYLRPVCTDGCFAFKLLAFPLGSLACSTSHSTVRAQRKCRVGNFQETVLHVQTQQPVSVPIGCVSPASRLPTWNPTSGQQDTSM